jgi:hypothetical protein
MYHSALTDPKVRSLAPADIGYWVLVLCMASEHEPRGTLPTVKHMSRHLRLSVQDTSAVLARLAEAELLDEGDGGYRPHNWQTRQRSSDSSAERVARYRMKRDGNVTPSLLNLSVNRDENRREREALPSRYRNVTSQRDGGQNGHDARNGAAWGGNGQSAEAQQAEFQRLIDEAYQAARRRPTGADRGDGGEPLPGTGGAATG